MKSHSDDAAVIRGELTDIKNSRGAHKTAVLYVEVPQESIESIIARFGWPTPANPLPVAVARLNEGDL